MEADPTNIRGERFQMHANRVGVKNVQEGGRLAVQGRDPKVNVVRPNLQHRTWGLDHALPLHRLRSRCVWVALARVLCAPGPHLVGDGVAQLAIVGEEGNVKAVLGLVGSDGHELG